MCGIAAIFAYSPAAPPPDGSELMRIRDHMTARGPDGAGNWYSPDHRVAFGHRRLSIIDLSPTGAQPMVTDDSQFAVTFNGEIYNYRELRSGLERRGCRFRSHSDTEVLLHLYREKGADLVHDLRGMYAFALWDGPRGRVFLARDPFGIKPLYYADDGQTFRCASQVKALLASGRVDTSPSPAGHAGFFLWGHVPEPHTLYRGIKALPGGHTLWIDAGGVQEPRAFCTVSSIFRDAEQSAADYWTHGRTDAPATGHQRADDGTPAPPLDQPTDAPQLRSAEALRTALLDTVRHHLIADVPVGVFLSSGIDSSTLAALAAETGGELRTVTLGFEEYRGTPNDEVPLAEEVARRYGAKHQTIWIRRDDFRHDYDRLLEAMDQPSIDGVNSYFVSKAARQAGLKVALSGLGGDELFAGYPSFRQIPRSVRLLSLFAPSALRAPSPPSLDPSCKSVRNPTRQCSARIPRAEHGSTGTTPPSDLRSPISERHPLTSALGRLSRQLTAPFLSRFTSPKYASLLEYGGSYAGAYLLRRGLFMPWELSRVMDPDLARAGLDELQTLDHLDRTIHRIQSPRLRVSALEMSWYMRSQLLRDTDWASMAHSLEVRVPLVDVELVRLVARQVALSVGRGQRAEDDAPPTSPTKLSLAQSPAKPLPPAILDRPKTGFTVPVRDWLFEGRSRNHAPRGLRGWAVHVFSRPAP